MGPLPPAAEPPSPPLSINPDVRVIDLIINRTVDGLVSDHEGAIGVVAILPVSLGGARPMTIDCLLSLVRAVTRRSRR